VVGGHKIANINKNFDKIKPVKSINWSDGANIRNQGILPWKITVWFVGPVLNVSQWTSQ
jgi:hypothetical protein